MQLLRHVTASNMRPATGKPSLRISTISVRRVLLYGIVVGLAFSLGFCAGAYKGRQLASGSGIRSAAPCSQPDESSGEGCVPSRDLSLCTEESSVLQQELRNLTRLIRGLQEERGICDRELGLCREENGQSLQPPPPEEPTCSRPKAAQRIPSPVVQPTTDLYLRRMWGVPDEDLPQEPPKNLLVMSVGIKNKVHLDYMMQKFPEQNFSVILFHYDDSSMSEWAEYAWSRRAVHIQAQSQGKWWYAKRFLHPDVTAAYDYVLIWDEDLGLDNLDVLRLLEIMRRHSLEMAQPALFPYSQVHHNITKLVNGTEVHKVDYAHPLVVGGDESECIAGKWPPCAGFVEVMAPVFTRKAWACVWYMIQNDLVNGWGLDLQFYACADGPAHENMGIIDAEYIQHQAVFAPDGSDQVFEDTGKSFKTVVEERSSLENDIFRNRWHGGLASDWDGPCTSKYDI